MPAVTDFAAQRDHLRRARYGVIEACDGRLTSIRLKRLPTLFSLRELWPVGDRYHARGPADRCRLFYNHPRSCDRFLALKYIVTTSGTGYATFRATLRALDELAELKGVDAIVCDAANSRLSDRFMARQGWAPHTEMRWRRNFIKRFYGDYPPAAGLLA